MPQLRERRKASSHRINVYEPFDSNFNLTEKRKLLLALKKYDADELNEIQKEFLPHRSIKEISFFIQKMRSKQPNRFHIPKVKVPIELWTEMAEALTARGVDYSYTLAEVLSRVETREVHDPKVSVEDPDWRLIYKYLVMLLKGDEPPDLGQIEAGVILDLMEGLAANLKSLDVAEQRHLMELKYSVLATRVDSRNLRQLYELGRQALDLDLLMIEKLGGKPGSTSAAANSFSNPKLSAATSDPLPSTSTQTPSTAATGVETPPISSQDSIPSKSSLQNYVIKSLTTPFFTINPFSVPTNYLNPKKLPSSTDTNNQ